MRKPLWVLGVLLLLGAWAAAQIPKLRVDPTPEKLLASGPESEGTGDRFRTTFGSNEGVLMVLVQAPNVLERPVLHYVHTLSRGLARLSGVERVESLSLTPLPRAADAPEETTLDDLDEADPADAAPSARAIEALSGLVEADPQHFPGGLAALSERASQGQIAWRPAVRGEEVDADEALAIRRGVEEARMLERRLISRDRRIAGIPVFLASADGDYGRTQRSIRAIEAFLAAHPPPAKVEVRLGGLPHLRSAITESMRSDRRVLIPLTIGLCAFFLLLSFRWWVGVFLPLLTVGFTCLIVVGGMGWAGQPMNILNNILPPLLIIIGISDAIHLVARYREERWRGLSREEACRMTVRTMALACFLTSLTTAVGLGSLAISRTPMLRDFGITAAIGVMAAYVLTFLVAPAVLMLVPAPAPQGARIRGAWIEPVLMRLTAFVLRRPWKVLLASLILTLGAALLARGIDVDSALLDQFDAKDPIYQTTRLLESEMEGVRPFEVHLRFEESAGFYDPKALQALAEVQRWAAAQEGVISTSSASDLLHEAWAMLAADPSLRRRAFTRDAEIRSLAMLLGERPRSPLKQYLSADGRQARLQIRLRDIGARRTLSFARKLEHQLLGQQKELPGLRYAFTGDAYSSSQGLDNVVYDLLGSLASAVIIIFVFLSLAFRSLRLGLLSIPSNLIPLVGTMAYMVLRGIPLNAATMIIFSITLGLSVDGSIHLFARFREERRGAESIDVALLRSVRGTGRALVVSCLTLMGGFGVFLISSFVPVRNFGELIAITITTCLFAALIVQNALLKVAIRDRKTPAEGLGTLHESTLPLT